MYRRNRILIAAGIYEIIKMRKAESQRSNIQNLEEGD